MILLKIIFACVICIILSIIVSEFNPEFKLYFTVIFGIIVLVILFDEISIKVTELKNLIYYYNIDFENFNTLLKIVLIAYVCDFISLICKDLKYESIGKKIELAGKFVILIYSFDILKQFIDEIFILFNG